MREKLNKTHLKCSRSPACCLVWSERVWVSVHEITGMSVMLLNDPVLFHLIPREKLYSHSISMYLSVRHGSLKANTQCLFILHREPKVTESKNPPVNDKELSVEDTHCSSMTKQLYTTGLTLGNCILIHVGLP